jgi:signal transduction histidine kinase
VINDRPLLISVLFWADLVTVVAVHAAYPTANVLGNAAVAALLVLTVLAWTLLRWRRGAGRPVASAAFVVVTCAVFVADGTGTSIFLLLIALAHVSLVFGVRASVLATAAQALPLLAAELLLLRKPASEAFFQVLGLVLFAAFIVALTTAVTQARQARDRADRLNDELAAAHKELATAHEELRRYAARVHELAVAEERTRMSRELHDSVGHHLTVIKVNLENAERYRERDPDAAWQDVRQAKTLTADALAEVRRGVRAMRPPQLDGRTGGAALRELARSFQGTGLDVAVAVEGDERALGAAREIVLLRVVQESLTNALRHSGGTNVSVRLAFDPAAVRLCVADDGRGAGTAAHGFGLTSLAERVRDVGGLLRAGDGDLGGFTVRVELPESV